MALGWKWWSIDCFSQSVSMFD